MSLVSARTFAGRGEQTSAARIDHRTGAAEFDPRALADRSTANLEADQHFVEISLVARDDRERAWRAVVAKPDPGPVKLARADSTGVDTNKDVFGPDGGNGRVLEHQSRRIAFGIGM